MDSYTSNKLTWGATIAVAVPIFYAGLLEFLKWEFVAELFTRWGYPSVFMVFVGAIQIVGVVLLLIPRMATFASGVLAVIMIGAVSTLLAAGATLAALVSLVILGLLLFIGWERSRVRRLWMEAHPHR